MTTKNKDICSIEENDPKDDFVLVHIAMVSDDEDDGDNQKSNKSKEILLSLQTQPKDNSSEDDNNACVICYYDSDDEEEYNSDTERELTQPTIYNSHRYAKMCVNGKPMCDHLFHTVCIYKWIKSNREFICPFCKQCPLPSNSKLEKVPELFPSKPEYIVQYYPNKKVKIEYFRENGQLNGKYKRYDPNGNPTFEAEYLNDELHGLQIEYHVNTSQPYKLQQYKHGKKDGFYEERTNLGDVIKKEQFKNGVLDGTSIEKYLATLSPKHLVEYRDGIKHGVEKVWTIDGKLIFYKPHRYGVGVGRCIARFPDNGEIERKCYYNDAGLLEGHYEEYQYFNDKLCLSGKNDEKAEQDKTKTRSVLLKRCHYKDGKYIGKYEEYHDNGMIKIASEYDDNGELDGEYFEYNRFGQCIVHYRYSSGSLDGWCERYSDEGKIVEQAYYILNQPHGIYKQFYPNGRTKMIQTFHKGIAHGENIYYNQAGKIMGRYKYINGVCKELESKHVNV